MPYSWWQLDNVNFTVTLGCLGNVSRTPQVSRFILRVHSLCFEMWDHEYFKKHRKPLGYMTISFYYVLLTFKGSCNGYLVMGYQNICQSSLVHATPDPDGAKAPSLSRSRAHQIKCAHCAVNEHDRIRLTTQSRPAKEGRSGDRQVSAVWGAEEKSPRQSRGATFWPHSRRVLPGGASLPPSLALAASNPHQRL